MGSEQPSANESQGELWNLTRVQSLTSVVSIEAYLLWSSYLLDMGYEGRVSQLNGAGLMRRWPRSQQEHCCGGCSSTQLSNSSRQRSSGGDPCPDKLTQLSCDSPWWLGSHTTSWNASFIQHLPGYPHISLVTGILCDNLIVFIQPMPCITHPYKSCLAEAWWQGSSLLNKHCVVLSQLHPMCGRMSSTWPRGAGMKLGCARTIVSKTQKVFWTNKFILICPVYGMAGMCLIWWQEVYHIIKLQPEMAENGLPTALCCPSRQSWTHGQRRRERECSADSWAFSFQLGYFLPFLKVISTANQAGTFFHSFLMVFFSPFTKYFLKASLYNSQSETWLSPAYPYHACFACMLLLLCSSRFFLGGN